MGKKLRIAYVSNSSPQSGVGLRAAEIAESLKLREDVELDEFYIDGEELRVLMNGEEILKLNKWPGVFGSKSFGWIRLGWKLKQEILTRGVRKYDLVHLTNQTLSFMAGGVPSVVTVHDIIEVIEPQQRLAYWINKYLYSGIRRASCVVAVSKYTAKVVSHHYGIPDNRIRVIYNGVGPEFHQIDGFDQTVAYNTLRQELRLDESQRVVLYVGSDHLRKNVTGAVQAFAQAVTIVDGHPHPDLPPNERGNGTGVVFVRVGEPGIAAGRRHLLEEIDRLKVRDMVRLVGRVSEERLNELYNLADVLLYPSKMEGFGLPPLQAMAAGTPVITSNATSLPEVVGDAAIMHDPGDVQGMAESLVKVLTDAGLAAKLTKTGLERVKLFSWEKAAEEEAGVYWRAMALNPKPQNDAANFGV